MVIAFLEKTHNRTEQKHLELSPTLQKAASATKKRDLQHYLEEEKRRMRKPLNALNTTLLTNTKEEIASTSVALELREIENPLVLIEDAEHRFASVFKEYESGSGPVKYPIFYWNSAPGHSPFVLPNNPVFPVNRPLPSESTTSKSTNAMTTSKLASGMTTRSKANCGRKISTPVFRRPTYTATTNKPKPGFCECCWDKFSDMDQHMRTPKHRAYARNSEHYFLLDNLLDQNRRIFSTISTSKNGGIPISPAKSHATVEKCSVGRGYTETKRRRQVEASRTLFDKAPSLADILSSPSVKRQRKGQTGNAAPIKRRLFV